MTLLPAPEREIGYGPQEPYDVLPYCAVPGCARVAVDKHEIVRRSEAIGVKWYVVLDGVTVGNRVGICRPHHRDVTGDVGGHRAWIRWMLPEQRFLWLERVEQDVPPLEGIRQAWEALGELDPHPPILESEVLSEGEPGGLGAGLAVKSQSYPGRGAPGTPLNRPPSESTCLHPSLVPGEKCPGCTYRAPHPRKVSSPATRQFGFHVPASDAEEFAEMEDTVFKHLGLVQDGRALKHARHRAVLTGYALILQETQPERAA